MSCYVRGPAALFIHIHEARVILSYPWSSLYRVDELVTFRVVELRVNLCGALEKIDLVCSVVARLRSYIHSIKSDYGVQYDVHRNCGSSREAEGGAFGWMNRHPSPISTNTFRSFSNKNIHINGPTVVASQFGGATSSIDGESLRFLQVYTSNERWSIVAAPSTDKWARFCRDTALLPKTKRPLCPRIRVQIEVTSLPYIV